MNGLVIPCNAHHNECVQHLAICLIGVFHKTLKSRRYSLSKRSLCGRQRYWYSTRVIICPFARRYDFKWSTTRQGTVVQYCDADNTVVSQL
eukprot:6191264-Pleurochrysis_carterae.AAC.1